MTGNLPDTLFEIRGTAGSRQTAGLGDEVIVGFWETDPNLRKAVTEAADQHARLTRDHAELANMDEGELCSLLQKDVLSFYGTEVCWSSDFSMR